MSEAPRDIHQAIEACSLLKDGLYPEKRTRLAEHIDLREFRDGDVMNQSGAGWEAFDDEISAVDPGTSLLLPQYGEVLRATLHPRKGTTDYNPKEIHAGSEGTGVFGWGSGVAYGQVRLTETARRIDNEPVFRMESYGRQELLATPSLASLIEILELTKPEVARALKAINHRLEEHLAYANHVLAELAPHITMTAPNLKREEVDAIPLGMNPSHKDLKKGEAIHPHSARLQVLGRGAEGHYVDQKGRILARVKTDHNGDNWHVLFPSRTIRIDAESDAHFVSSSKKGTHITVDVNTEDPAVIATMNRAMAFSAASTAQATWKFEGQS